MSRERHASKLLTSWKEIADYLRIAVRTAQLWEHEIGLPVHRMPGRKGRISVDSVELDHWRRTVYCRRHWVSNPRRFKLYAMLVIALLVVTTASLSLHLLGESQDNSPDRFQIGEKPPVVVDHRGNGLSEKACWKTGETCVGQQTHPEFDRRVTFRDIDGDGELETILDYSPLNICRKPDASNPDSGNTEESRSAVVVTAPACVTSGPSTP